MLEQKTNATDAKPNTTKPKAARAPKATGTRTAASKTAAAGRLQEDVRERIRRRAYELWESEGRPEGREHTHWLQAEQEIARTRRQRVAASG
jgi:Protein of unknown function (DUF2934)